MGKPTTFVDLLLGQTTRKLVVAAAIGAAACAVIGDADAAGRVFTYACHPLVEGSPAQYKHYTAKLDLAKNALTWHGYTFKGRQVTTDVDGNECAKFCFEGKRNDGKVFLSTATQGSATLTVVSTTPGADGAPDEYECNVLHNK